MAPSAGRFQKGPRLSGPLFNEVQTCIDMNFTITIVKAAYIKLSKRIKSRIC